MVSVFSWKTPVRDSSVPPYSFFDWKSLGGYSHHPSPWSVSTEIYKFTRIKETVLARVIRFDIIH